MGYQAITRVALRKMMHGAELTDAAWSADEAVELNRRRLVERSVRGRKYRDCFLAWNGQTGRGKLPYCVVEPSGQVRIYRHALSAIQSVLHGGRGGVDLPDRVKVSARARLEELENAARRRGNGPLEIKVERSGDEATVKIKHTGPLELEREGNPRKRKAKRRGLVALRITTRSGDRGCLVWTHATGVYYGFVDAPYVTKLAKMLPAYRVIDLGDVEVTPEEFRGAAREGWKGPGLPGRSS